MQLHRVVLLLASTAARARGQIVVGFGGSNYESLTTICNQTFDDANSTGIFSIQPNVAQGKQAGQPDNYSGSTRDVSWGVTVSETLGMPNASAQLDLWYSTTGANYSYDIGLYYDVCVFTIGIITQNTMWRGQTDNGKCLATFDSDCVSALEDAASGYALGLVSNPTPEPNSNLTAGSLPQVCYDVANSLQHNFPKQCLPFMNDSLAVTGTALTDAKHSEIYGGCTLMDSSTNNLFHHMYSYSYYTQDNPATARRFYDYLNYNVAPMMLTFLPVAKVDATQSIGTASSKLACVHADHVNPGSRTPALAPTPTPIRIGNGVSAGAIAGIVVGVVVAVALIAGGAFWFWRRRRVSQRADETTEKPPAYGDAEHQATTPMAEAPTNSVALAELSPDNGRRPELSTQKSGWSRAELGDSSNPQMEQKSAEAPAEMLGDVPQNRQ